ncbi:hypothetical protein HYS93_02950 [Candidatus Daviesbacteria bacterium]|nr:hypothetical protein [Candidatus Daviesbacteria bacterium]
MPLTVHPGIGTQTITATPLPKTGDREDFSLRVQGPDPNTDFEVPLSITGTALAVWGSPSPTGVAENLGAAIFKVAGTASLPPKEGFWFDSYNSGYSLQDTINKIANQGTIPFAKNWVGPGLYVKSLGGEINKKIQELDALFSQKFNTPFFKSLEDIAEESQRVDDLNTPAKNNPDYLYKICLLSGIIDHINVRLDAEDEHVCTECNQRHHPSEGSLQGLKRWLASQLDDHQATVLVTPFQMIKKLRKQYPIHDHYVTAKDIRIIRKEISDANAYFNIIEDDFAHNAAVVTDKFGKALNQIIQAF